MARDKHQIKIAAELFRILRHPLDQAPAGVRVHLVERFVARFQGAPQLPGIKVVAIEGAKPTQQAVRNKTWPYARPTFYYTNGEPSGVAKQFLDFTLSSTGQKIVDRVGFVGVNEVKQLRNEVR
ncbi:MAG: hypothetical protein M3505_05470 [Verrucomicrobiota bacterium]|nr:hypothetical protein [Verrucomicrobiota bacterium]